MKLFLPEEHEPGAGIRAGAHHPAAPPAYILEKNKCARRGAVNKPGQTDKNEYL